MIRRDTGVLKQGLANEVFTSNPFASSKQTL